MSNYNNLLGMEYIPGKQDCYSIVRRYFADNYDLNLRNYARPDRFWEDSSLDLYQMFVLEGARPVHDDSIEIGDVILVSLLTPFAAHACIVVGDNLILHHPPGKLSCVEPFRPRWQSRALNTIRHPKVTAANKPAIEKVHLHEVIDAQLFQDPGFQGTIARVLGSDR
jgi:cell wall-associated NlpC family hydrolase